MDSVEVREAEERDAEAFATFIRRIWTEAGPDAPGFAGATDEAIEEIARSDTFSARITDPAQRLFLAVRTALPGGPDASVTDPGEVVGFCATRAIDDQTIELAGIVVRSDLAGRGIGTMLVDRALAVAGSGVHRRCVVRTETTNLAARSFYERCGFTDATRQVEVVDGNEIDVWELQQSLAGPAPPTDVSRSNPPSGARSVD